MEKNIKQEIISYLTKTSNHIFIKPKCTFNYQTSSYDYDFSEFTYFKVIKKSNEEFTYLEGGRIHHIDIDYYIKYWGDNAKDVLSNSLFQMKKMKSVKKNKFVIEDIGNKHGIYVGK